MENGISILCSLHEVPKFERRQKKTAWLIKSSCGDLDLERMKFCIQDMKRCLLRQQEANRKMCLMDYSQAPFLKDHGSLYSTG